MSSGHSANFVMSPRFGTWGQRAASTADGNASISLNASGVHPNPWNATVAASMPEHMLMYFISSLPWMRYQELKIHALNNRAMPQQAATYRNTTRLNLHDQIKPDQTVPCHAAP